MSCHVTVTCRVASCRLACDMCMVLARHAAPCRVTSSLAVSCCVVSLAGVTSRRAAPRRVALRDTPLRFARLTLTPRALPPLSLIRSRAASVLPQLVSFRRPTHVFQLNFRCGVVRSFYLFFSWVPGCNAKAGPYRTCSVTGCGRSSRPPR